MHKKMELVWVWSGLSCKALLSWQCTRLLHRDANITLISPYPILHLHRLLTVQIRLGNNA